MTALLALVLVTLAWNVTDQNAASTRLYQIDENGTPVQVVEIAMPATTASISFSNGRYVYCATSVWSDGQESDYSDVCAFTVRHGRVRQTYP